MPGTVLDTEVWCKIKNAKGMHSMHNENGITPDSGDQKMFPEGAVFPMGLVG